MPARTYRKPLRTESVTHVSGIKRNPCVRNGPRMSARRLSTWRMEKSAAHGRRQGDRMQVSEGKPYPLGATAYEKGANFAVFSANATKVEVCFFDTEGRREVGRRELPERTDEVFHGHVTEVGPATLYGFRVHGPYEPEAGHRFNPNKLLLDPYARAHSGKLTWNPAVFGYTIGAKGDDLSFDKRDSAPFVPKSV